MTSYLAAPNLDAALATRATRSRVVLPAVAGGGQPDVELTALVTTGAKAGKCVWIQACLHGDEPGAATLVRAVMDSLEPARLVGSVVAVPVGNPPAYQQRRRTSPIDGKDINRAFPGKPDGGHSERLVNAIWREVSARADALIDVHSSNLDIHGIEHVMVVEGDDAAARQARRLAEASKARYLCPTAGGWLGGTLFTEFTRSGRPAILFDRGNLFDAGEYRRQVGNFQNVLAALGMIDGQAADFSGEIAEASHVAWLPMPCDGEVRRHCGLGDRFTAGQLLAEIDNLAGDRVGSIIAPKAGVVVAWSLYGYMHKGEGVFLV